MCVCVAVSSGQSRRRCGQCVCVYVLQSIVGGLEEGVASMCGSVSWIFQYASEAVQRCFQLTRGWGCHGLLKSLQVCV